MASLRWIVVVAAFLLMAAADDSSKQKYVENKRACSKIVRSSQENVERYLRSEYPEDHETACFMRCVGILSGSYDDETGVNLDSLYEAFGKGFVTREEYQEESKVCLEKLDEVSCHCMKAYKPLMCLKKQYKKRKEATAQSSLLK
ncbi:general odorant-binding protein 99a-like [Ochlerotatus camptorhynchus]|uniref:general odorant-binding protein 99a-like n=1 Tax=Ochlerotatus camptorhynchus TaxID=644619 RepID=UPI0031D40519